MSLLQTRKLRISGRVDTYYFSMANPPSPISIPSLFLIWWGYQSPSSASPVRSLDMWSRMTNQNAGFLCWGVQNGFVTQMTKVLFSGIDGDTLKQISLLLMSWEGHVGPESLLPWGMNLFRLEPGKEESWEIGWTLWQRWRQLWSS